MPALVALALAAPAHAYAHTVQLGRSWDGRPIVAVEVGNPAGTKAARTP